jgi:hypothetical protein
MKTEFELNKNKALVKTDVSSSYFDKHGDKIGLHDILFYSEFDGTNKDWHYADSIYLIIEIDGELYAKAKVITINDAKSFENYDEQPNNMLTLDEYCKDGISKEFLKIGTLKDNPNMLESKFANETYSCR